MEWTCWRFIGDRYLTQMKTEMGVLRGCSEFLESDGTVSEVSGDAWNSGVWLAYCWGLRGWLEQSQGSGKGSILDQMGSQQSDRDLNNLTHCPTRK